MKKYDLRYEMYGIAFIQHANYPSLKHKPRYWKVSARVIDVISGKVLIDYNSLEFIAKPNKRDLRKLRASIMWEVKNFIRSDIQFTDAYDDIR
ncbi:TPA: hypothetical protein SMM93_001433 [Proteus mirabilis]